MAVTKIWSIKGSIDKVLSYAANPDKTEYTEEDLQSLRDVMDYAMQDYKTEKQCYVSGINCVPKRARKEMMKTKERADKLDGILAFHAYQSFAPGEVTPAVAHEIGKKLAEKMWGDKYEVIVATHVDREHIHSHFVINSVSFVDGKKYNSCKESYRQLRKVSDDLCRQYGLSVIENPEQGMTKSYDEYEAEKNGEPTKNSIIKHDIDECIKLAMTEKDFYYRMKKRGYTFNFNRKYVTVSHAKFDKPRRLKTLGDDYTPESITKRIDASWRSEEVDIPKQEYPALDIFRPTKKTSYQAMYVQFVTVVSIVKSRPNSNRNLYKLLGDEIRKLNRLIEQQNLLCGNDIDTSEQLTDYKDKCNEEITELTEARKRLRSQLKSAERKDNEKEVTELKEDISNLSERLKKLRRDILVCDRIKEQEPIIKEKIDKAKESNMKEMMKDEQFRRRR
ncbi:MAG: relaxase/mobilization nuclease domain-containing protein [Faecalibacterium sp.]|nr:relaxase/mobilization nuclease domain-containing protein [Ruminococcus flavefaciens]MCM1391685.1 relaxase/mobilization nuclease domain-containing protein [Ruminococcus sp.]MCM1484637.1 relaxase/mobilization nuclease domain-containing protein [Faecalibacterium sp.]